MRNEIFFSPNIIQTYRVDRSINKNLFLCMLHWFNNNETNYRLIYGAETRGSLVRSIYVCM